LDDASIDGKVPAKSGECADDPILTDHRGFNDLSGGKTDDQGDNRTCRKVDVRDLIPGLKQNSLMVQVDGFQMGPKSSGVTL
jgi:hypothetical protein